MTDLTRSFSNGLLTVGAIWAVTIGIVWVLDAIKRWWR